MNHREKAIELVKAVHKVLEDRDTYWNITDDAKVAAKASIDIIAPDSEDWQKVKAEIDLLPYYIEDVV